MGLSSAKHTITIEASADLSASQFRFMSVDSSGQLAATGDGAAADGVLQDKPAAAGRAGLLQIGGRTKVEAGAAVTNGAQVASDSVGRVVPAASGDVILGRALNAASAAGEVIAIIFQPRGSA